MSVITRSKRLRLKGIDGGLPIPHKRRLVTSVRDYGPEQLAQGCVILCDQNAGHAPLGGWSYFPRAFCMAAMAASRPFSLAIFL
jgi:hypothetical protein